MSICGCKIMILWYDNGVRRWIEMNVTQLIEAKKEKGYSNAMISRLSGVPLATVQKIFSGETESPRYDTVQALSKVFEQKTVYYSDTGSMNDSGMVKEAIPAYGVNIPVKKRRKMWPGKSSFGMSASDMKRVRRRSATFRLLPAREKRRLLSVRPAAEKRRL